MAQPMSATALIVPSSMHVIPLGRFSKLLLLIFVRHASNRVAVLF